MQLGITVFHPSEDEIETYLRGRIAGTRINETVEEHLLGCSVCLDWAQSQEHTIRLMRASLLAPKPTRRRKVKVMTAGWLF